jgi:hypothetical protein
MLLLVVRISLTRLERTALLFKDSPSSGEENTGTLMKERGLTD